MIHRGDRLLDREETRVGELAGTYLPEAGIDIRFGVNARRGRRAGGRSVLDLDDGTELAADVVIFATGRTPRTQDLGFEQAGVVLGDLGQVRVDEHCRAGEKVWAIGDVTGIMAFTHVAKYQGRIAADAILGKPRKAFYEGIPRVVFAHPEIAAVGLTRDQAGPRGLSTEAAEIDLAATITRPWTYERDPRGHLGLLADNERKVLIGAWAVAPMAGEWIHQASLAIRARIPIDTLRDQVAQYPTYNEAYQAALDELDV